RVVEAVVRQVVEGPALVAEAQIPARLEAPGVDLAHGAAGLEPGAVDPDVGAVRRRELIGAEGRLGRPRPRGLGVEDGQPQRRRGSGAGSLVDGVADPDPLASTRPRCLDVVALVVAGAVIDGGEPGGASHGANLSARQLQ